MEDDEIISNGLELPKGWAWKTIGEVCDDPQYGWTTSAAKKGNIKLLRTTDITSGIIDWDNVPYCEKQPENLKKYLLKDGDIVISRAGSVGYSILLNDPENAVFASYLIRFRPKSILNKKYFSYFLKSPSYWKEISENKLGIAIPNVNASKLKNILFPLASFPEQEQIVSKIEELFTQLDAAEAALKRAKINLKRYKQSLLQAAVTGKLTKEWREAHKGELEPASNLLEKIKTERKAKWEAEIKAKGKDPTKEKYTEPKPPDVSDLPELPHGWCWVSSDQLFHFVTSGSRGWAKYYSEDGANFLRIGNLDHGTIALDLNDVKKVKLPSPVEGLRTRVNPNDILISITADVGMIGLVPENLGETYINQHVSLARPVHRINADYLAWYLASEKAQKQFTSLQRGATKMGLGLDDIKNITVPFPSVLEQGIIVSKIEENLILIERQFETFSKSLQRIASLRNAVLRNAFTGKLIKNNSEESE